MQVQRQRPQRRVVGVRQRVDDRVQAVPPHDVVVALGRLDKPRVVLRRQQRVRQIPQELLQ